MRSHSRAVGRKARTLNWTKPQPSLVRARHSVAICRKKKDIYESLLVVNGGCVQVKNITRTSPGKGEKNYQHSQRAKFWDKRIQYSLEDHSQNRFNACLPDRNTSRESKVLFFSLQNLISQNLAKYRKQNRNENVLLNHNIVIVSDTNRSNEGKADSASKG